MNGIKSGIKEAELFWTEYLSNSMAILRIRNCIICISTKIILLCRKTSKFTREHFTPIFCLQGKNVCRH